MGKKKVEPSSTRPGTSFEALSQLATTLREQKVKADAKETVAPVAAPAETPPAEVAQPPRRRKTGKSPEETLERSDADLVKLMASEMVKKQSQANKDDSSDDNEKPSKKKSGKEKDKDKKSEKKSGKEKKSDKQKEKKSDKETVETEKVNKEKKSDKETVETAKV